MPGSFTEFVWSRVRSVVSLLLVNGGTQINIFDLKLIPVKFSIINFIKVINTYVGFLVFEIL